MYQEDKNKEFVLQEHLLKKPKILILDDSTSAVDTKTDALIRKAFREEIPNTTKIIIAQRISSIEDADKIIVLNNGRIDGIGTSEELLKTNQIYREVYESQMKGDEKKMEKKTKKSKTAFRLLKYVFTTYKLQFFIVLVAIILVHLPMFWEFNLYKD